MGVLNVTPDSFSDGGLYKTTDAALCRASDMLEEGAVIIDIGGESSRPRGAVYGRGAARTPASVELRRVLPVIKAVTHRLPQAIVSVDTYKPDVAEAALEAGAHMINDISGLRHSAAMAAVAERFGAPLVIMHAVGALGDLVHEVDYDDPVASVRASLQRSVETAKRAGVRHVIVDPGFGFGKTPEQNLQLVNGLDKLLDLGHPVLIGISRKSTIGWAVGRSGKRAALPDRLYGTLGATAVAVMRGASLVRTHDVRPTVELLRMIGMITV